MSPFAHHASSQSAQFSSRLVTRAKSPGSTPCDVNRGPQLAMADLTCSSGTGILSLRRSGAYAIICSAECASVLATILLDPPVSIREVPSLRRAGAYAIICTAECASVLATILLAPPVSIREVPSAAEDRPVPAPRTPARCRCHDGVQPAGGAGRPRRRGAAACVWRPR